MTISVENNGPELTRTNYWRSEHARRGLLWLSINAGTLRILVPPKDANLFTGLPVVGTACDLEPLIAAYPAAITTDDLASASGYGAGGGAFNNIRGRLRTLGLADYPRPGHVRAADLLFPDGTP